MANKTFNYVIGWAFKEDGNRDALNWNETRSTTAPRAISKVKKELVEAEDLDSPSEILIMAVWPGKLGPGGLPKLSPAG